MEESILRQNSFSVLVWNPSFLIDREAHYFLVFATELALSFACCHLPAILSLSPERMAREGRNLLSPVEKVRRRAAKSLLLDSCPLLFARTFGELFEEGSGMKRGSLIADIHESDLSFAEVLCGKVRRSTRKVKKEKD